jgi:hypothetical protein
LAPTKWQKTEARRDRGDLPEGGNGGGTDKRTGGAFFYSSAFRGVTRACARRERGRWRHARVGRATGVHARAARHSSDVTVATALCGGNVEGVCPYVVGEEVSGTRGGWWWPSGTHGHASAWCLRGAARDLGAGG